MWRCVAYRLDSTKIHVVGYPCGTTEQEIYQLFENYGEIVDIEHSDRFTFVVGIFLRILVVLRVSI